MKGRRGGWGGEDTARWCVHLGVCTLYLEHESVLNVEHNLLLLSIVSYEGVDGVTVRHPADEARVGGEGDDRVALNAVRIEVTKGCGGGGRRMNRIREREEEEEMDGEGIEMKRESYKSNSSI